MEPESLSDNEKTILKNLQYLNESIIIILILIPFTLIVAFETLDSNEIFRWISIITWIIYIAILFYIVYRIFYLNTRIKQLIEGKKFGK